MIKKQSLASLLKQLTALSQASQAVTASLNLNQVLKKIISLAGKAVNSQYTTIILFNPQGQTVKSAENISGIPSIEYRKRKKGFTRWILKHGRVLVTDKVGRQGQVKLPASAPQKINPDLFKAGIQSMAGLPLKGKKKLLGVLFLHSRRPYQFGHQLALLNAFANQAAVAVENARLYQSARKYEFIVNTSKEMMSFINQSYVYKAVNQAYYQAHGLSREKVLGKTVAQIWGQTKFKQLKPALDLCFKGQEACFQGWFHFGALNRRYFQVTYYPYLKNKKITHAVEVAQDITKQKKAERALKKSRSQLKKYSLNLEKTVKQRTQKLSNLVKSQKQFIANLGHELRTPLAVVKALVEFNLENTKTIKPQTLVSINQKVDLISQILKNLSLISRLEIGGQDLYLTQFNLKKLILEILEDIYKTMVIPDQNQAQVNCAPQLKIKTDQVKLTEILFNLFKNAFVHADKKPQVKILVKKQTKQVKIIIEDQNAHIPKKELKKIFLPFYRTQKARRLSSGSGLGLYLCQRLAQLLGGQIQLKRKTNQGHLFILQLPI